MRVRFFVPVVALASATSVAAQAPDTVRTGTALQIRFLAPGVDTVDSRQIQNGTESPVSIAVRTIERAGDNWRIVVHHSAVGRDDRTVDTTLVAGRDLHLMRKAIWALTDSAVVVYRNGRVTGWATPPNEERRSIDAQVAHPVLPDDGLLPWLWTLLPLSEGYAAAIETFGTWDGEMHVVTFRVIGSEEVEREGRKVDCWVVTSDRLEPYGIHARALVEKGTRRVVRSDAWTDDGTRYISEPR